MKQKVTADTSIWIEYLRNNSNVIEIMDNKLMDNSICIVGVVREIIRQNIDAVEYQEIAYEDWIKAGEISNDLRKNGITLPMADIVIAATAQMHGIQVLTFDNHFKQISNLTGLNLILLNAEEAQ